jgi:hypothetical protein
VSIRKASRRKMEGEEYMNRKQQEAEIAEVEVSILITTITIITVKG